MENILKKGQIVLIQNKSYTVIGMIRFKEDTWEWQEYKIIDENKNVRWLNIEQEGDKSKYSIYDDYRGSFGNLNSIKVNFDGEEYSLHEEGKAKVINSFGNVDVDMYEKCNYREYINSTKTKIISVEDWTGEIERSIGYILQEHEVKITDQINKNVKVGGVNNKKLSMIIYIFVFAPIVLSILIPILSVTGLFTNKSMQKFIKGDSRFTYVTSITNSTNKKKANVYETNYTVEETVKMIIDGVPEGVQKVVQADSSDTESDDDISDTYYSINTNDSTSEEVGLLTNSEYAYVYSSTTGKTYVQVSSKDYLTGNQENAYRSRYRYYRYTRTYTSNSTDATYTSYLNSAKQSSVNSRMSSGGGTSSGK